MQVVIDEPRWSVPKEQEKYQDPTANEHEKSPYETDDDETLNKTEHKTALIKKIMKAKKFTDFIRSALMMKKQVHMNIRLY